MEINIVDVVVLFTGGIAAGTLAGLLGIGGGIIFMPMLIYYNTYVHTGVEAPLQTAVVNSVFAVVFAAGRAAYKHYTLKNIRFKKTLLVLSGSVFSLLIIPHFLFDIPAVFIKGLLITIILIAGISFFVKKKDDNTNSVDNGKPVSEIYLPFFGILAGAISVITGIGGGVLMVPMFYYLFKFPIKNAIASSSFIVALNMLGGTISYAVVSQGNVNLMQGLYLGLGAFFGARLGVKILLNLNETIIKRIFSLFLFVNLIIILLSK